MNLKHVPMQLRFLKAMSLMMATSIFVMACSDSDNDYHPPAGTPETSLNIVATAEANGNFDTLVAALNATGLDATLADESETFTVFAPTDDAFAALGEETINALLADPDTLSNILLYHVIGGQAVNAAGALAAVDTEVEMANGVTVALTETDGVLYINNAAVTMTDVVASNGVIHVIDKVIVPADTTEPTANIVETAVADGRFETLVAALQATDLDATLADESQTFTVFAPTDDAFAVLGEETINTLLADTETLSDILLYHVVPGAAVSSVTARTLGGEPVTMANGDTVAVQAVDGNVMVNNATVIIADIQTVNGVIHVIDAVLTPPADEDEQAPTLNIVETAVANGSFTTLVTALQATGLDATLADESTEYTVFAPTDAAFEVLGDDAINDLLANTESLSNILLYHVVAGSVDAATAVSLAGTSVEMANGSSAALTVNEGNLFVDEAQVTTADIQTSNGIIHVIDAVLIP